MKNWGRFNWYKVIAESIALSLSCTVKSFLRVSYGFCQHYSWIFWTAIKIHQIWLNGERKCWKSIQWVEGYRNIVLPRDFWQIFQVIYPTTEEQYHEQCSVLTAAEHVMIVIKEIKIFKESSKTQIYSIILIQ